MTVERKVAAGHSHIFFWTLILLTWFALIMSVSPAMPALYLAMKTWRGHDLRLPFIGSPVDR